MNEKAFNPDPMFRQRKPIGTQPEAVAGLIRFIDALLCLAAAFLGGDATGRLLLVVNPERPVIVGRSV